MKTLITSIALMFTLGAAQAQTTATDFTANDCNGGSHNLFADLNSGKVVVLVWVMPCGACVGGGSAAYNAVQNLAASNPGKIIFYLADDTGDDNCSAINSWASSNGIDPAKAILLNNTGNVIKESNFGGSGMPHIVVAAGNDHKIYFNEKNGSGSGVQAAIQTALNASGVSNANSISFSVFPNPVNAQMQIRYNNPVSKVSVMNIAGQVVKEESYTNAKTNPVMPVAGISAGVYLIRITDVDGKSGVQKVIFE